MLCSACGFTNIPDARFCSGCGQPLPAPALAPQVLPLKSKKTESRKIALVILGGLVVLAMMSVVDRALSGHSESNQQPPNLPKSVSDTPAAPEAPTVSYWRESVDTSPMDGKTTVVLSRISEDSYSGWLKNPTPRIALQCYSTGHLDLFVDLKGAATVEYGDDLHTVRIKLDDAKPFRERWSQSKDDEALFSRSPAALISQMVKHKVMLFEFDPFNTPTSANVSFDLSGLSESMAKHSECSHH